MARTSKDIAKRLRFDRRPRPDAFRRWYWVVALLACGVGAGVWLALARNRGERQYLPGPLSAAHATFGDRCSHCHVAFAATPDDKCLACHARHAHSPFAVESPRCARCHVEHRAPDLLVALSDRECIRCHGDLQATHTPEVTTRIASFAAHPEFVPLRAGQTDAAAVRFNHRRHLTSADVKEPPACAELPAPLTCREVGEPLTCAKCHVLDADGRYMQPIVYERHCRRCHELKVTQQGNGDAVPSPLDALTAPHQAPPAIHDALLDALLALGAQRPDELFAANRAVLLPGRAERGPIDEARSLKEFAQRWRGIIETALYAPFTDTDRLLEKNTHCFLCHLEKPGRDARDLPLVAETHIPTRWLMRGEFSHRKHDRLPCATCHPAVETSTATADVNLPHREVCAECHADGRAQSAGTACIGCHRYHDTGKDRLRHAAEPELTVDILRGRADPPSSD